MRICHGVDDVAGVADVVVVNSIDDDAVAYVDIGVCYAVVGVGIVAVTGCPDWH